MDPDRVALESRIAFLEKSCDDLHEAAIEQQQHINRLERSVQHLQDQLEALREDQAGSPSDERPPHY